MNSKKIMFSTALAISGILYNFITINIDKMNQIYTAILDDKTI